MSIKDDIKALITKSGWTMSQVAKALNEKYNRSDDVSTLSNKLTRETLKLKEAMEIADIIGYRIEWIPKDK